MYKYVLRINVDGIDEAGRSQIFSILDQDKGRLETLNMDEIWFYLYIEYDELKDADNLVRTLLKIKDVQNEYPANDHTNECFIVTNKLTL